MDATIIYIGSILSLSCAGFCCFVAHEKNRSMPGWFASGLLFNIVALITVAGLPSLPIMEEYKPRGIADRIGNADRL